MKGKGPVVHLNRSKKAMMINAFLCDALGVNQLDGYKILDVGCGNGQIGRYFCDGNSVYSVDVVDQRDNKDASVKFNLIQDEKLPFEDGLFDIVISHHVIEHVEDQGLHLQEITRVLKQDGLIYLGCPNRGSPFMAGHVGNDMVLNLPQMESLFDAHGLQYHEYYTRFLCFPDDYYCDLKLGKYLPAWFVMLFRRWYPGQCFILRT